MRKIDIHCEMFKQQNVQQKVKNSQDQEIQLTVCEIQHILGADF